MPGIKKVIRILCVVAGLICVLALSACFPASSEAPTIELGQLAANNKGSTSRLILRKEGRATPFLVLGYYGKGSKSVLLLREFLLKELSSFNLHGSKYYADSVLDRFLNEDYFETLSEELQSSILDTSIEIAEKHSVERAGLDTEFITRKIFALSLAECGFNFNGTPSIEGTPVQRLLDIENRISSLNGEYRTSWLRTPNTWHRVAWALQGEGMYTYVEIDKELGVRPAFCMRADTKIKAVDNRENAYELSQ